MYFFSVCFESSATAGPALATAGGTVENVTGASAEKQGLIKSILYKANHVAVT